MRSFHWKRVLFTVILNISYSYKFVFSKHVKGHLITHKNWAFLDRFCFLSLDGSFEYQIEFEHDPEGIGPVDLLMYPDLHWPSAYQNPRANSCEKKKRILSEIDNQIVPLIPGSENGSGCELVNHSRLDSADGNSTFFRTVLCKSFRKFRSARERWWFISIAACNSSKGLDVKYKFDMKNGERGDYWYEHFSADEFYILPILTAFCFIYIFLLFCALIFAVELKCRQLLHTTYKLFLLSLVLQTLGIMNLCLAYGNYASNGGGLPGLKLSGRVLESGSEFVFVLLLLLLAKGFTVTRGRLRPASAVKLTIFNCLYVLLNGLLFVFEQYTFDPGMVLYIYESWAGYGILILRLVGYLMFVYGIFFTLKHYPEKSSFYFPFFGIYSLWFISGPIMILISNHVIDKWVREKVAVSIQHSISFVGHVVFLGLTRPSAANKSFPYHVRTSQVGMMDDKPSTNGQAVDSFEAHSYAPTAPAYDIFTVSGVVQRNPYEGPNFDLFNANGSIRSAEIRTVSDTLTNPNCNGGPSFPAMFAAPPPKYDDAFPHETPGQVEEMLREPEEPSLDGSESGERCGCESGEEIRDNISTGSGNNNYHSNNNHIRSALSPPFPNPKSRENKYICD